MLQSRSSKAGERVVTSDKCACHKGRKSLSPAQWARMKKRYRLTPRELEAVQWLFEVDHRPYIAAAMGLSLKTVDKHLASAFKKTGVHNRGDLILTLKDST